MELLTQLRLRATRRVHLRQQAIRDATHQMAYLEGLVDATQSSGILVLRRLEHIMAALLHRLIQIRTQEDEDAAIERRIWGEEAQ
ncbi:hypothetical protein PITC_040430 [Penicillium italicum]|uniref:Uncharacterized protein n=1 Tax=Penicillium italicum TaxID=40296 RepID=A0A0A2KSD2_PENIT|nr:hypothetical protein PITC_040430 [Penicillium italicum]